MRPKAPERSSSASLFPKIGVFVTLIFCLIFIGWMLFFTLSEAHSRPVENWWIAKNPENPAQPFYFLRSYIHEEPFHLLWGFEGLRKLPAYVNLTMAGLILLPIPFSLGMGTSKAKITSSKKPWQIHPVFIFVGVMILAFLVFFSFRVPYETNRLFGDAYGLPGQAEDGFITSSEVLTLFLFNTICGLLRTFSLTNPGYYAIAIVSSLAGGLFLIGALGIANRITEDTGEKILLFIALFVIGTVMQFFGYIETTALELAFMLLFFACAMQAIYNRNHGEFWLWGSMGCTGLALLAHAAGLLLMPSLFILLLMRGNESKKLHEKFRGILQVRIIVPFILLVILPYAVAMFPFILHGDYGNATGGGDHIAFVLLKDIDYAHRPSEYIYYDMFSLWHLIDIISALVVGGTTILPLVLISFTLRLRSKEAFSRQESQALGILGTAAVSCGLIPILWNHDYGMWGDWNIATTYLFPFHIFGWVFFLFSARRFDRGLRHSLGVVIPLLMTQFVGLLGLALQFYR